MKIRRTFLLIPFLLLTTSLILKTFKKVDAQDITIIGNDFISKDAIINNSSLNLPTPLIFIETKYTEKELIKNLSFEKVSVTRRLFPFGLKILIKTRTPKAYGERIYKGGKISGYIDENGFFIDKSYIDIKNFKKLKIRVFGWKENFKTRLSKILTSQYDEIEIITINFSPNGFLTLEEKHLKTIMLGFDPKKIETQLQLISNMKIHLKEKNILKKIDNIDLTNPNNPKIKVFKP